VSTVPELNVRPNRTAGSYHTSVEDEDDDEYEDDSEHAALSRTFVRTGLRGRITHSVEDEDDDESEDDYEHAATRLATF
jgi:hypothetical protein